MKAVTATIGTMNRATDMHSSQPPTGRMAWAESPAVLRSHGEARGVRGLSCMLMRGRQRRGGVVQQRHPHLRSLNSVRPDACSTCAGRNVFQQIFAEHWEAFQHAHPRYQTSYYDGLVAKMLACGNPDLMGYVE